MTDNGAVVIRGNFLKTLRERMQKVLRITEAWCKKIGLKVNPLKTKVVVFTRKYKPEPIEPLRLFRKELEYASTVKYLGILFDSKLNWKQNLLEKKEKFYIHVGVQKSYEQILRP